MNSLANSSGNYHIQGDQKKRRQNLICPDNKVFYGIQLILLVFGFSMFLCLVYICSLFDISKIYYIFRMSNKRSAILELFRKGMCDIVRLLNVPKQTVSKAVNRIKELGHDGRRPGSGRRRTVNTSAKPQIIRKRAPKSSIAHR